MYHQEKGRDWLQMEPTIVVLSFRFPGIKLSQSRQRIPSRKGATMIPGCLDVVRGDDRFEAPPIGRVIIPVHRQPGPFLRPVRVRKDDGMCSICFHERAGGKRDQSMNGLGDVMVG